MLFDWLVVGHVLNASPAHAVRGPKHVIRCGKPPVLTREETRELLDAIETDDIAGLRDRALIGLLVFSFARIGAALTLNVDLSTEARRAKAGDYFPEGKRWKLRPHEKGGKATPVGASAKEGARRAGPPRARTVPRRLPRHRPNPRPGRRSPLQNTGDRSGAATFTQADASVRRVANDLSAAALGESGSAGAHAPPASRRRSAATRSGPPGSPPTSRTAAPWSTPSRSRRTSRRGRRSSTTAPPTRSASTRSSGSRYKQL